MKPRQQYPVTVTSSQLISPSIIRLTLQSDDIAHFGAESQGGYLKLLFNPAGDTDLSNLGDERPVMRTYTIREFDQKTNTITVDVVRHITQDNQCGFASRWAEQVKAGDSISIAGPGKSAYPAYDRDWVFFVADSTALPALAVALSQVNSTAKGYAVIEINNEQDIQNLVKPEGVELIWVTKSPQQTLAQAVTQLVWLDGDVDVWCACEFDDMRALRDYFRNQRNVEHDRIYISSYWKNGVSEDGHKVLKRQYLETQS